MSVEQNKQAARLYVEEGIGKSNYDIVQTLVAQNSETLNQRFGIKENSKQAHAKGVEQRLGLPDLAVTLDSMVAEGDTVIVFWHYIGTHLGIFHGAPPTGNIIRVDSMTIFRFRDGKIIFSDTVADRLDAFIQLESTGDYLPVLFGDTSLDGKLELKKGLRPRAPRPELDAVVERALAPFANIRAGDDVVEAIRGAMGHYNPPSVLPRYDDVDLVPVDADGVPAEWAVPKGASGLHRVVHCHGGGFIAGGIATVRSRAVELARLSGACVLTFDYRLAPEHPFPAGLDDCGKVLAWAADNGFAGTDKAGSGSVKITLSGDSAGASLAVATCAEAITHGRRLPDNIALLSGQLSMVPHFDRVGRDDRMVDQDNLWYGYNLYTKDVAATDPRISPLYTPLEILAQFPPILIQVSGDEAFLWDARKITERLVAADARCTLSVWPGMIHCWHSLLDIAPEARQALQEAACFITS